MERCPNCGQMGRAGARFCTICGYRIVDDAGNGESAGVEVAENVEYGDGGTTASAESGGWPAPPASDTQAPDAAASAKSAGDEPASPEPSTPELTSEELPSIWSTDSGTTWPAASDPGSAEPARGESPALESAPALSEVVEIETEVAVNNDFANPNTAQRDRALTLLDELRGIVGTMEGAAPPDLSGIIAELEVAVTPPGAVNSEELATLREALLSARARPRDLDTVVDLTGRIDAMVALIFAYDRAIAAIERALEVLRQE